MTEQNSPMEKAAAPVFLGGLEDWRKYLKEGGQFLDAAQAAVAKGRVVFTPEILYNMVGMAIEKFIMAYLMRNGDMADNHTMRDLVDALERHAGPQPALAEKLYFLDTFQEICDMDTYNRHAPNQEDIGVILAIGQDVREFVLPRVGMLASA